MPYDISLMKDRGVIEAVFSGSVTIAERIEAMQTIAKCSQRSGAVRLLADFQQARPKVGSHEETTAYAEQLASEPTLRKMTIAYVGTPEQTANIELVAAVRGYFFQRFSSTAAALRWLE